MILPDSTFHNQASDDYLIRISFTTRQVQKLNTSFAVDDTLPHWSPTGEWVALGRTGLPDGTPTWGTQLWLMRPDGSRAQPLVTDKEANFGAFAWRSDGGALAYVRLSMEDLADPRPELWIVDLSDRQPRLLARDAIMPDWLP